MPKKQDSRQGTLDLGEDESQLRKYIDEGNRIRNEGRAKPEASDRPIYNATDEPKALDVIEGKVNKPIKTTSQASMLSPKGNITRAGSGGSGSGGGADMEMMHGMMTPNPKPTYKKGGKVSSASKRADGCITKGHTKGKYL